MKWNFTSPDAWRYVAALALILLKVGLAIANYGLRGAHVRGGPALIFLPMVVGLGLLLELSYRRIDPPADPTGVAPRHSPLHMLGAVLLQWSILYLLLEFGAGVPDAIRTIRRGS